MGTDDKTRHFQIKGLHAVLHNQWQKFCYINRKGAEGWVLSFALFTFWGMRGEVSSARS